jgi:hypothetical protein
VCLCVIEKEGMGGTLLANRYRELGRGEGGGGRSGGPGENLIANRNSFWGPVSTDKATQARKQKKIKDPKQGVKVQGAGEGVRQ